jgi:hypothetical protein
LQEIFSGVLASSGYTHSVASEEGQRLRSCSSDALDSVSLHRCARCEFLLDCEVEETEGMRLVEGKAVAESLAGKMPVLRSGGR